MLYIDRTVVPWRDLPPAFGARDAVYQRFRRRRRRNGTWATLWRGHQTPAAASARRLFVDSTVVRAHQHAAGGPGDEPDRSLGRSRGGCGTKIHITACDERTALGVVLTAGQAGDAPAFQPTLCDMPDETTATAVVADRAYDSDEIRAGLAAAGFEVVIPARSTWVDPPPHDAEKYKERQRVERLVSRLKRMRRVTTRYEKRSGAFLAMVQVACAASSLL